MFYICSTTTKKYITIYKQQKIKYLSRKGQGSSKRRGNDIKIYLREFLEKVKKLTANVDKLFCLSMRVVSRKSLDGYGRIVISVYVKR
jgi:hypothetical protein